VHGHEIKADRGDWLREMKDADKAEPVAAYMDYWWLVAPSTEVVKIDELPRNWGLLVLRGEALAVKKQAARLEPKPLDRPFLAAILRKAQNVYVAPRVGMDNNEREKIANDVRACLAKEWEEQDKRQQVALERRIKELQQSIEDFQNASGVRIDAWHAGDIGRAVAAIRHEKSVSVLPDLCEAMAAVQRCHDGLKAKADAIRALGGSA
jgi:hypothetical protein